MKSVMKTACMRISKEINSLTAKLTIVLFVAIIAMCMIKVRPPLIIKHLMQRVQQSLHIITAVFVVQKGRLPLLVVVF